MKECWREEAENRPTFVALKKRFVRTLSEKNAYTHFINCVPEEGSLEAETNVNFYQIRCCL